MFNNKSKWCSLFLVVISFFVPYCLTENDWFDLNTQLHSEEIQYYLDLITAARDNGQTYQFPQDASEHAPKNPKRIHDSGEFDFVIIGAGAAGSVLANRLSEVPHWRILVLEAGGFGDDLTDIPNMYFPVEFTPYNWGYFSTPQTSSCLGMQGRRCPMARGKGIGGTTLINGLVYSRGSRLDFDRWAAQGNLGWSYNEVLPYFKKSENFNLRYVEAPVNFSVHGLDGLLNVEYHLPRSPQLDAFLSANEEIGVKVADYNAENGLGASPAQINTKNGHRWDCGKAFVHPALHRRNLKVLPYSLAVRILFDQTKKAYGVVFTNRRKVYLVKAKKEVLLSAGAINSPHLLMLSGVGPYHHLKSLGIPVVQHLEVGSALRDHPTFYGLNFETNYSEPIRPLEEYIEEFLEGFGPLAAPGNNQGVAFYESSFTKGTGYPDIEIMMIPSNATSELSQKAFNLNDETYKVLWGHSEPTRTFILYIIGLHSESQGTVRLKSKNPFDYPVINTRFLSDPHNKDIRTLYEGVQIALELASSEAFQKFGTTLQGGPLKACGKYQYLSAGYWYCALRQVSMNIYHPVGTCPMGVDVRKGEVVDAKCKVHGVRGLRVVDASVFPFTLAGHPVAPTVMVGEKVADLVKWEYLGE